MSCHDVKKFIGVQFLVLKFHTDYLLIAQIRRYIANWLLFSEQRYMYTSRQVR